MHKVVDVKPLENYRVWLKFYDGKEGTIDLSKLVGKGVFQKWRDKNFFNSVFIDPESHTIAWQGDIDLCPDTLYAEIIGKDPIAVIVQEQVLPS